MPNFKSAAKRARQNIRRQQRNRQIKSMVKSSIRNFEQSLLSEDVEEARTKLRSAVRRIDKAAAKGVIHKNYAARQKSRLSKMINKSAAV